MSGQWGLGNAGQSPGGGGPPPRLGTPASRRVGLAQTSHFPASAKVLCRGHWLRASCRRGARREDLQEEERGSSSRLPTLSPAAVLKAEQAAVFKFPLAPLGCSGLGSALLAAGPGLPGAAGAPHLPLELQLRGKLEAPGAGEPGTKAKKGRRSRTVFTELQLMGLEKRFEKQKYLSTPDW